MTSKTATILSPSRPRAFSLIEVLIAIFILGIGVISIATLFPAGMVQQQRSIDDVVGPIVAENAMSVLRSKLRPEFFGRAEDFDPFLNPNRRFTVRGDWEWRRPPVFLQDVSMSTGDGVDLLVPAGSISLFRTFPETTEFDDLLIPWNFSVFRPEDGYDLNNPPTVVISQWERFYPQVPENGRPQYVWDCMFRKFQGRVLVAIFVYRVRAPGGRANIPYRLSPIDWTSPGGDPPQVPIRVAFGVGGAWNATMGANIDAPPNDQADPQLIPNTFANAAYNPFNEFEAWQLPGQFLLDQNNNVHRVLAGREVRADGPLELARPVPPAIGNPNDPTGIGPPTLSPNYYYGEVWTNSSQGFGLVGTGVVSDIWYLPEEVDVNGDGDTDYLITPVYVAVREL